MWVEKKTLGHRPFWTSASTSVPGAPPSSAVTFSQRLAPNPGREMAAPSLPADALLCTRQPCRPRVWVAAPARGGAASRPRVAAAAMSSSPAWTRQRLTSAFIRSPPERQRIAVVKRRRRDRFCKPPVEWPRFLIVGDLHAHRRGISQDHSDRSVLGGKGAHRTTITHDPDQVERWGWIVEERAPLSAPAPAG